MAATRGTRDRHDAEWGDDVVRMYEVAARAAVGQGLPPTTVVSRLGAAVDPRLPATVRARIMRAVRRVAGGQGRPPRPAPAG